MRYFHGGANGEVRRLKTDSKTRKPGHSGGDYREFIGKYPEYESTSIIDDLRASEFSRLDAQNHVYLDYTGGGLYSEIQVLEHERFLLGHVLGNPHSTNPSSAVSTDYVERCRHRILKFFNASPDEYVPIFTANATHALKLIGEGYPFCPGDVLLLSFDNHNSVNGLREFDRAHGAVTKYVPVMPPDMRILDCVLERHLDENPKVCNRLFAFPAQSNFSGVQHPLEWIEKARGKGWDVLLDAAAFVPTNPLDLARWHPDYVAISFYKMFGYPTGVGALIARREALEKLRRPWFAGGTITVASVQADRYFLAQGAQGFEDGTLNYACIPAVERGLDFLDSIGMNVIHSRVMCLAGWLIEHMASLEHGNGRPVVRIYGPTDTGMRGATVAFNVYDADGATVDHVTVEQRANAMNISLRTGCFCNPGAGELALGLSKSDMVQCLDRPDSRMSLNEFRQCIDGKNTGAVRVSLGLVSNFEDVARFLLFLDQFRQA
ncbi:MAG: aminotransferase class V-fold PLP-dependent enzyme [Candidatus Krumholzibacteria bacterium]|nr:aminotransferase class V-fold PLP-dependent enzyme [Candidatus Krumholzibacteria bacterium]